MFRKTKVNCVYPQCSHWVTGRTGFCQSHGEMSRLDSLWGQRGIPAPDSPLILEEIPSCRGSGSEELFPFKRSVPAPDSIGKIYDIWFRTPSGWRRSMEGPYLCIEARSGLRLLSLKNYSFHSQERFVEKDAEIEKLADSIYEYTGGI